MRLRVRPTPCTPTRRATHHGHCQQSRTPPRPPGGHSALSRGNVDINSPGWERGTGPRRRDGMPIIGRGLVVHGHAARFMLRADPPASMGPEPPGRSSSSHARRFQRSDVASPIVEEGPVTHTRRTRPRPSFCPESLEPRAMMDGAGGSAYVAPAVTDKPEIGIRAVHACIAHDPACRNQPRMSWMVTLLKASPIAS